MSPQIPLLIVSDGASNHTGLARIARGLAYLLTSIPQLDVGYLGRGDVGRKKFPWVSYPYPESQQWGEHFIEDAWMDLAGDKRGIVLTVWDATRLLWFADPVGMPDQLQKFLLSNRFERWGYFMQDSEGPVRGTLPLETAHVMAQYDRVLLASKWAYGITRNTLPNHKDIDWLPHGMDTDKFKPMDGAYMRSAWGIPQGAKLIGCVASNQERKHWPTMIEAVSMIPNAYLWMHTDTIDPRRYWNFQALLEEYGMTERVRTDGERKLADVDLAMRYSACDATLLISGGEGFSFCTAESLACGIPQVTGSYSAQAELNFPDCLVEPAAFNVLTRHNVNRAVYRASDVALKLDHVLKQTNFSEKCRAQTSHLHWEKIGLEFKKWVTKGLPK